MAVTRPDTRDALTAIREAGHTPGTQEAEDYLTTVLDGDRNEARTRNNLAEQAAQLEEKGWAVHGLATSRSIEQRLADLEKRADDLETTAGDLQQQLEAERAYRGSPIRDGLDTDADPEGLGPGEGVPVLDEPDEEPPVEDYNPGPEVDDQGGMSEINPWADQVEREEAEYFGGMEAGR